MQWVVFAIIMLHGLIHFIGPIQAFELGNFEQISNPISKGMGLVWLVAALIMLLTGILFIAGTSWWWIAALFAIALSQIAIIASWQDAKAGTIANVIILAAVIFY